jgi:hypothetical protein
LDIDAKSVGGVVSGDRNFRHGIGLPLETSTGLDHPSLPEVNRQCLCRQKSAVRTSVARVGPGHSQSLHLTRERVNTVGDNPRWLQRSRKLETWQETWKDKFEMQQTS